MRFGIVFFHACEDAQLTLIRSSRTFELLRRYLLSSICSPQSRSSTRLSSHGKLPKKKNLWYRHPLEIPRCLLSGSVILDTILMLSRVHRLHLDGSEFDSRPVESYPKKDGSGGAGMHRRSADSLKMKMSTVRHRIAWRAGYGMRGSWRSQSIDIKCATCQPARL